MYFRDDMRMLQNETPYFNSFTGRVVEINNLISGQTGAIDGCTRIYTLEDDQGNIVNFVVGPNTYFVNSYKVTLGSTMIGFYNANAPTILIYPPQYQAMVMANVENGRQVKVDRFDDRLISSDGSLQLNITRDTIIELENGQSFEGSLGGRNLIVIYSVSTRSIPAQTIPEQVIVMCRL